ncbi:MAG TPA: Mth938-like domain-containing protein [Allosphingosinicella sp.]
MPRPTPEDLPPGPLVQGFREGGFAVDGRIYRGLFLTPERAAEWVAPETSAALTVEDVEQVLSLTPPPEFLILGTGRGTIFPPRAFIRAVEARGLGVEVMDSRAAARTWGLLRGEERWIAAALMPLS